MRSLKFKADSHVCERYMTPSMKVALEDRNIQCMASRKRKAKVVEEDVRKMSRHQRKLKKKAKVSAVDEDYENTISDLLLEDDANNEYIKRYSNPQKSEKPSTTCV